MGWDDGHETRLWISRIGINTCTSTKGGQFWTQMKNLTSQQEHKLVI